MIFIAKDWWLFQILTLLFVWLCVMNNWYFDYFKSLFQQNLGNTFIYDYLIRKWLIILIS